MTDTADFWRQAMAAEVDQHEACKAERTLAVFLNLQGETRVRKSLRLARLSLADAEQAQASAPTAQARAFYASRADLLQQHVRQLQLIHSALTEGEPPPSFAPPILVR